MSQLPNYTVCVGGLEYAKGKRPWTRIGAAWVSDSGAITIKISFPCNILIGPNDQIRLFKYNEKSKNEEEEF